VDLKSQKFVDVSLDSIVAAMNIPRNVGKPPWDRSRNNGNNNNRNYGGGGGGGRRFNYNNNYNNYNNNYSRRFFDPPRVKRLRDDRYRSRPRGWNTWSHTGGMYSDSRGSGRDYDDDRYGYGRGNRGSYGRAPKYSNWYNRRNNRYDEEDEDWVDEDAGYGYGGRGGGGYSNNDSGYYGQHWNSRDRRSGGDYRNDSHGGYRSGRNNNSGSRSQQRYQPSASGSRFDDADRMDTDEARPFSSKGESKRSNNAKSSSTTTATKHKVLHWPTLLISNLNPAVTDLDIYDLFQEFGNLKRANVHHDKYGNSLQTADVVFFSEDDAKRALREYDNTPLDGCLMRIFLCNSFSETSVSSRTSQTSVETSSHRGKGADREVGGGDAKAASSPSFSSRPAGSRSANPSSMFKVNDISTLDSNKNFVSNFSDEMKHYSSKPRIPIKQGKWWHQQSRVGRADY